MATSDPAALLSTLLSLSKDLSSLTNASLTPEQQASRLNHLIAQTQHRLRSTTESLLDASLAGNPLSPPASQAFPSAPQNHGLPPLDRRRPKKEGRRSTLGNSSSQNRGVDVLSQLAQPAPTLPKQEVLASRKGNVFHHIPSTRLARPLPPSVRYGAPRGGGDYDAAAVKQLGTGGGLAELVQKGLLGPQTDLTLLLASPAPLNDPKDRMIQYPLMTNPQVQPRLDLSQAPTVLSKKPQPSSSSSSSLPGYTVNVGATAAPQSRPGSTHQGPSATSSGNLLSSMLDAHSAHTILIRRGRTMPTPEFESFQRLYTAIWPQVARLLAALETLSAPLNAILEVDGHQLAQLASDDVAMAKLLGVGGTHHQKPSTLLTRAAARHLLRNPTALALDPDAAARVLQRLFRCLLRRKRISTSYAARIIQKWYRRAVVRRDTLLRIQGLRDDAAVEWTSAQAAFLALKWNLLLPSAAGSLAAPQRVLALCVPLSPHPILQKMALLQALALVTGTPGCDAIVVLTRRVEPQILDSSAYQLVKSRLRILYSEWSDYVRAPEHQAHLAPLSPLAVLAHSDRLLRRIHNLRAGYGAAVLVPCMMHSGAPLVTSHQLSPFGGDDDVVMRYYARIGLAVHIPPSLETARKYYCRSGTKRILGLADANVPLGAYDLSSRADVYAALERLAPQSPSVECWIVLLDSSPVHPLFASRMESVPHMLIRRTPEVLLGGSEEEEGDWREQCWHMDDAESFWGAVEQVGCVVEALPLGAIQEALVVSANSGVWTLQYATSPSLCGYGARSGSTLLPAAALLGLCSAVEDVLRGKGLLGPHELHVVSFVDAMGSLRVWCLDVVAPQMYTPMKALWGVGRLMLGLGYDAALDQFARTVPSSPINSAAKVMSASSGQVHAAMVYPLCDEAVARSGEPRNEQFVWGAIAGVTVDVCWRDPCCGWIGASHTSADALWAHMQARVPISLDGR
jgi:hypothetical protein